MAKRIFNNFANKVVTQLPCNSKTKKRIREDIIEMLEERCESSNREEEQDPEALLGKPSELAAEFMENLDTYGVAGVKSEWISDTMVMWLPIYHIVSQQGRGRSRMVGNQPVKVAKGIIAIGPVAVGGVAIGGLATAKEVAIGGVTTAKLMLYSQSYQLPNGLNQGSVYAFNQNYGGDFFAKFKEVYEDFGLIKQRLVQMFSRSF